MVEPMIYNRIFQRDQDGMNILEELIKLYYDRKSYVKGDTHDTAFREGQRDVVKFLLNKSGVLEDLNAEMDIN